MNISKLQQTKTFMPPFSGSPHDLEAIVQFLRWNSDGRPQKWDRTDVVHNRAPYEQIKAWMDEAGPYSGIHLLPKAPQPHAPSVSPGANP